MNSKWKQEPKPPAEKHPPFQPRPVPSNHAWAIGPGHQALRIVREALSMAYDRTPWDTAIQLHVHRPDVNIITHAVALLCTEPECRRIWVMIGGRRMEKGKTVMLGMGRSYAPGTAPWGPAPIPEPLPPPMTEAEWRALNQGDFPPPMKPE